MPYLGEVGTEEFLMKLTSQITEMVSAKITQGKPVLWTVLEHRQACDFNQRKRITFMYK